MNPINLDSNYRSYCSNHQILFSNQQLKITDSLTCCSKEYSNTQNCILSFFKKICRFFYSIFQTIFCCGNKQKVQASEKIMYVGNPITDFLHNPEKILEIRAKNPIALLENLVEEFLSRPMELFSSLEQLRSKYPSEDLNPFSNEAFMANNLELISVHLKNDCELDESRILRWLLSDYDSNMRDKIKISIEHLNQKISANPQKVEQAKKAYQTINF